MDSRHGAKTGGSMNEGQCWELKPEPDFNCCELNVRTVCQSSGTLKGAHSVRQRTHKKVLAGVWKL